MAGTPQKVRLTGHAQSDIYAMARALNQLITDFDAHKHKTPTANPGITSPPVSDASGAGSTGGTAALTTATPIYDANTGAAPAAL
jgi:hypothetical protein